MKIKKDIPAQIWHIINDQKNPLAIFCDFVRPELTALLIALCILNQNIIYRKVINKENTDNFVDKNKISISNIDMLFGQFIKTE